MKQTNLFGGDHLEKSEDKKYSDQITVPIYTPKGTQPPHIKELLDMSKTKRLMREINAEPSLSDLERKFLLEAARRHSVFHYERIADYYAHANPIVQNLMERSALVIVDFERAIELGYVRLCDDIKTQYMEEYEN
jgi:hypothetical protein